MCHKNGGGFKCSNVKLITDFKKTTNKLATLSWTIYACLEISNKNSNVITMERRFSDLLIWYTLHKVVTTSFTEVAKGGGEAQTASAD